MYDRVIYMYTERECPFKKEAKTQIGKGRKKSYSLMLCKYRKAPSVEFAMEVSNIILKCATCYITGPVTTTCKLLRRLLQGLV